tara:strand:- start:55 stop:951 length:897 start_codon:yes stop_codon:yes gene_type:complete
MIEPKPFTSKGFHLAGIVPVAGPTHDFNFDWHDSLMPISQNYTAVERSVMECAWAGCETIWIVCNDDMTPLIRHRLGEWVQDPVWYGRSLEINPSLHRKPIPIYYVPIHPKDRKRVDSYSWSVLYGALTAYWISKQMSQWIIPDKFYVSFTYGIYPPIVVRKHRKTISSTRTFALSYNGKTVKDNEYLGFTFDSQDFINCRKTVRQEGTRLWKNSGEEIPTEKLPLEKRWSSRNFTLDKVFKSVIIEDEPIQLDWYYNIDCWDGYCSYIGSDKRWEIQRPNKEILNYHEWNGIGIDEE